MPETPEEAMPGGTASSGLPTLLVLASTYPRWQGDPEPGFVHELSKRLTDRFRVVVLCPHAPGALPREVMEGVEVIRYRYAPQRWETLVNDGGIVTNLRKYAWKAFLVPSFVLAQAWHAWRLARERRIQVIHAHWLIPQGLICAVLNSFPGRKIPFLVTSHGADLFALKGAMLEALKRFVISRAGAVTVVSESMRGEIDRLGGDMPRVYVEPMGVDLQRRFHPDPAVARSRNEILFVGRMVEKKGLRHLLDAMPTVLAQRPQARLTVAGFGPEEKERRAQAEQLNIAGCVRFLGAMPQSDLPALYRRAAVFVAPFVQAASGDQEGLGLVLVEALGCQCPVVVSDLPATWDVGPDASGLIRVPPADAVRLAEAIVRLLDGAPGRNFVSVERFGWPLRATSYAEHLASLMLECPDDGDA